MTLTPQRVLTLLRSGEASADLRRSLALGTFPLGPAAMIEALITLAVDEDSAIRENAVRSLRKIPRSMVVGTTASAEAPPHLLHRLARIFSKNEDVLETILLNPSVQDQTVAFIATLPYPLLLEIVGRGQERFARCAAIGENLRANPKTPAAVLSLLEETEARRKRAARDREDVDVEKPLESVGKIAVVLVEEEKVKGGAEEVEKAAVVEEKKLTIQQLLKEMTAGQKVALAMKGNSEVRKILIREKNRLVCEKVLENPRITDTEIESFAKSTSVSEDVLRYIGNKREWVSQPAVVRSLVTNPRTPLALSLAFLKRLNLKELEGLSKNRNIPEALRNTARKMHKQKSRSRR